MLCVGRWGRDENEIAMCVNSDINFRCFAVTAIADEVRRVR